jgi:hypothetical protein
MMGIIIVLNKFSILVASWDAFANASELYTFSLFVCVAMCQGDEFIYS